MAAAPANGGQSGPDRATGGPVLRVRAVPEMMPAGRGFPTASSGAALVEESTRVGDRAACAT
jgi:hypothetical protein